ncbi:CDP-glycerol glycerophosphotransferase family protein [Neisseria weixii]|uniref:CDP-glycerol glycerophosphotransferase family protein n=1 Tax=Neisseria weixii TaxID=1853276 RepID=UPI0018DFFE5D|nr:CDP-glycerol glycerophosphotransferase family protein [Neisseria weixii]
MKIADILISDYSSLVLDFALLHKPIVLFQYDYEDYMNQRGVYFNFSYYLPAKQIIKSEEALYQLDWQGLSGDNHKITDTFYPLEDGQSTQRIVEALAFDPTHRHSKDIIFLVNELNQIGGVHSFLQNMAKHYKQKYNARIFVIAIREFAETNSEFHQLQSPYIDFKLSAQYLNGACANILQNTDGIVISLQFSAHLHFQKYLENAKSVLMFHGDVKDIVSREMYGPHLGWLNEGKLYNYRRLLLLTQSSVDLLRPHLEKEVQNKLDYIHNSIDAQYRALAPQNPLHTAVISRLDEDKNIFSMIDLGKEIIKQNAGIVINIYGDGALKDEFQTALKNNGLQNVLKLHGFESNKEKSSAITIPCS